MFKLTKENLLPHDEKTIESLEKKRNRLRRKLVEVQAELIVKEHENATGFRATGTDDDFTIYAGIGEHALEMLEWFVDSELSEQIKSELENAEYDAVAEKVS